jgi:pSer/pThr/pTyr-binding forkhead associated (FHA) protein
LINQRHVIFDLGSKSGTYVNGAAVSSSMLRPGDVIRLGGIPIVYGQEAAAHLGHTQKMDGNQGPVEIL